MSRVDERKEELELRTGPAMAGPYNDENSFINPIPGGYPFCHRGVNVNFPVEDGGIYAAKATLGGLGTNPQFVLQVTMDGAGPGGIFFREAIPTGGAPVSNFKTHAEVNGDYVLNAPPVDVVVQVIEQGQGLQLSITPK
jgi:hypothetical protein